MKQSKHARAHARSYRHLAGWLDILGCAVKEAAPRIQRIHIQVADTVFSHVNLLAPTRPAVAVSRTLHHLISDLSYTSVRWSGAAVSGAARLYYRQFRPDAEPKGPGQAPFDPASCTTGDSSAPKPPTEWS